MGRIALELAIGEEWSGNPHGESGAHCLEQTGRIGKCEIRPEGTLYP